MLQFPFRSPMLPAQRQVLRTLENAFVVFALLLMTGSLRFLYQGLGGGGGEIDLSTAQDGNKTFQLLMLACFGFAGLVLVLNFRRSVALAVRAWPLCLFLAVVIASIAWSAAPDLTMRRGGALVLTSAFAFYLCLRYPDQQLAGLIVATALAVVWINFLSIFIVPDVALQASRDGALRGLLGHKNDFGRMMILAGLALSTLIAGRPPAIQLLQAGTAFIAFAMAVLSGSATAILVLFMTLAMVVPVTRVLATRLLTRPMRITIFALTALVGTAGMVVLLFAVGLDAVGKDATLTNRTLIWDSVWQLMLAKLPLGYGYGAFWEGSSTGQTWALYWNIGHAHNGYLDLLLDLGLVGAATLLLALVITIGRLLDCYSRADDALSRFYLLSIVTLLIFNTVAHAFPDHSTLQWVIMSTAMIAYASRRKAGAARKIPWRRRAVAG